MLFPQHPPVLGDVFLYGAIKILLTQLFHRAQAPPQFSAVSGNRVESVQLWAPTHNDPSGKILQPDSPVAVDIIRDPVATDGCRRPCHLWGRRWNKLGAQCLGVRRRRVVGGCVQARAGVVRESEDEEYDEILEEEDVEGVVEEGGEESEGAEEESAKARGARKKKERETKVKEAQGLCQHSLHMVASEGAKFHWREGGIFELKRTAEGEAGKSI